MPRHAAPNPDDFGAIVGRIYEAATNPSGWREALRAMRGYLHVQSSMLFSEDLESREVSHSVFDKADSKLIQEYYDHYIHKSPLLKAKLSAPRGAVMATNMLMADRDWERHEFYFDFLRRCERYYEMGALIRRDGTRLSVLSLIRGKRQGGFSKDETRRLEELVPHIVRAYDIAQRIGAAAGARAGIAQLLDQLPMGMVLFNRQGQPVHRNRSAERLLRAGHAQRRPSRDWLEIALESSKELTDLIGRCIRTALGQDTHTGRGITIARVPPAPALRGLVTPLRTVPAAGDLGTGQICAALFLSEPSQMQELNPGVLRDMFGLTEAESLIVRELADGKSPQEISGALHVSWHTVRTQQRAIYDKLGVSTQSQLVKTVLSSPACVKPEDSAH